MLHLGLEVPYSSLMEVLGLSQCGERDDVAAFPDPISLLALHLPFLYMLLAFLHLRQSTCEESGTRMRINIDLDSIKREVMINGSTGYTRLYFAWMRRDQGPYLSSFSKCHFILKCWEFMKFTPTFKLKYKSKSSHFLKLRITLTFPVI